MKKIFFFMLSVSRFLISSDSNNILEKKDVAGIIKDHIHRMIEDGQKSLLYHNEVVYRALRGGNHLTIKDPLMVNNPEMYARLHGHIPSTFVEDLPKEMKKHVSDLRTKLGL